MSPITGIIAEIYSTPHTITRRVRFAALKSHTTEVKSKSGSELKVKLA